MLAQPSSSSSDLDMRIAMSAFKSRIIQILLLLIALIMSSHGAVAQQLTPSPTPSPSPPPDALVILEKVNSFYSGAFTQLITITIAFLAIAGVILPIIFQIVQVRVAKSEQRTLQGQIEKDISLAKQELKVEIEERFKAVQDEMKKTLAAEVAIVNAKLEERSHVARGVSLFIQGTHQAEQKRWGAAVRDLTAAAELCFRGNDETNGQRALTMVEQFLSNLNSKSFETVSDLDRNIDDLLEILKEKNQNGRFSDAIDRIGASRTKAKKGISSEAKTPAESAP